MAFNLKILAKVVNIEMDKGGTFRPVFYVLDSDNEPVNLSGYGANMQIKVDYSDATPLFDLSVTAGSITIIGAVSVTVKAGEMWGDEIIEVDTIKTGVYGLQPHITATNTSSITQDQLVYQLDLIEPSLDVIKYIKGDIILNEDGTT
jgi:hypothetical protein